MPPDPLTDRSTVRTSIITSTCEIPLSDMPWALQNEFIDYSKTPPEDVVHDVDLVLGGGACGVIWMNRL
jgi:hypothetical protein